MVQIASFWTAMFIFILAICIAISLMILSSISAVHASDSSCYKKDKNIQESYRYSVGTATISGVLILILFLIIALMMSWKCGEKLFPFLV